MGALANATPWKGATAEESAAYAQQVALANAEFEREVVQAGGPTLAGKVDADKANALDTKNYNVMGTYRASGIDSPEEITQMKRRYGPALRDAGIEEFASQEVNALGMENANPQIFAHEFQHRRHDIDNLSPWLGEEKAITLQMAYRADTPEDWMQAVSTWYAINRYKFSASEYQTMKDVEKHLITTIDSWRENLENDEIKALEERGNRPRDREGRFWGTNKGDHRQDVQEAAARRVKLRQPREET